MACVGAASACMDVDALFSSHWEQDDSLTRFVCSLVSLPRLVDFKWASSSNQVAAKAVLVVDESPAVKNEVPAVPVEVPAVSVEVPADSVEVPADSVEVPADSVEVPADSVEVPADSVEVPADSVEVLADLIETAACSAETAALSTELVPPFSAATPRSSAEAVFSSTESSIYSVEKAWWLAVLEPEEVTSSFLVAGPYKDVLMGSKAQKGAVVDAEASSRRCSLNRNESACLIDLTWDTCSSSSNSFSSTQADLLTEVASGKRGIGRGLSSTGKGWNGEMKGIGKAEDEGVTFSNQLFGDDDEDEDDNRRSGFTTYGTGNMCYMNQLYMDEEDEEERRSLAASGISVGIGRFAARMLSFHEEVVAQLHEEGGLAVLGAGLGLHKTLSATPIYSRPCMGALRGSMPSADRVAAYREGGCFAVTSRILIVDMLSDRVPFNKLKGIVVVNAHRVTDTGAEAFILRLFRDANKHGFIYALSDRPNSLTAGFHKAERILKALFLRRLYLWPRFQVSVSQALEQHPPHVEDVRVPLSPAAAAIQQAIVDIMGSCLQDLRRTNKLDVDDLTVESGLFKSFDEIVRRQLDPVWHTLGRKIKQLVADLRTLRKIAEHLLRYDSVTFLRFLDALKASESKAAIWIFVDPAPKIFELAKRRVYQVVRSAAAGPPPLAAHHEKQPAKKKALRGKEQEGNGGTGEEKDRVGGERGTDEEGLGLEVREEGGSRGSGEEGGVELQPVLEEMPKWKVLRGASTAALLAAALAAAPPVLVACKDECTSHQLRDIIFFGAATVSLPLPYHLSHPLLLPPSRHRQVMQREWQHYLLAKADLMKANLPRRRHAPAAAARGGTGTAASGAAAGVGSAAPGSAGSGADIGSGSCGGSSNRSGGNGASRNESGMDSFQREQVLLLAAAKRVRREMEEEEMGGEWVMAGRAEEESGGLRGGVAGGGGMQGGARGDGEVRGEIGGAGARGGGGGRGRGRGRRGRGKRGAAAAGVGRGVEADGRHVRLELDLEVVERGGGGFEDGNEVQEVQGGADREEGENGDGEARDGGGDGVGVKEAREERGNGSEEDKGSDEGTEREGSEKGERWRGKGRRGRGRGGARGRKRGGGSGARGRGRGGERKRKRGWMEESLEEQEQGEAEEGEEEQEEGARLGSIGNNDKDGDDDSDGDSDSDVFVPPSANGRLPGVHLCTLEGASHVLERLQPGVVVVYDPDIELVRQIEVFHAARASSRAGVAGREGSVVTASEAARGGEGGSEGGGDGGSTEGHKFEASVRRENGAFEQLIRQKAVMTIPAEQDGRSTTEYSHMSLPPPPLTHPAAANAVTRRGGGRRAVERQEMRVVVDMREFNSSLPCVLHQRGIKILPVTLEVGDYILSPAICVERKSVSDLFASFASGRLHHQAETMCRYYRLPVLLIEFSSDKSFSLQSASDISDDITPSSIISKMSLLALHFPRLRIVWSRSLHATAEIFASLKTNQDEPSVDQAMRVGVPTEDGLVEGDTR
ncbi:unnamed protein product [Closterium sp. Naga37s-1]|nr:unnamed protein product [Closterium sp. Naga37s-1]CAI5500531.1 unnamed protein product [Closterium sp. Naga37s-1]